MSDKKEKLQAYEAKLQALSIMTSRLSLASSLGMQYNGDRDIYQALGYPTNLKYDDFILRYLRQDIGKAIVKRPVDSTWKGKFSIIENDEEDTLFEKAWDELSKRLKLKQSFIRLDKLASLGKYGVLFFGFDDVVNSVDFMKPVMPGKRKLLYVKPLSEVSAIIDSFETNPKNPRYGLPLYYTVTTTNLGSMESQSFMVHYSRILHVTGETLESEYYGIPVLEVVFNRLLDLDKTVGGSGEMFWRGARPGYQGVVAPDTQISDDTLEALKAQIDEYEHNLRRILINQGIELSSLSSQVTDPSNFVDVQIQMISAVTGIPKRILTGSERGELSSSQDEDSWNNHIAARREEYAEEQIIHPFIDRCIETGVLPTPKEAYSISWEKGHSLSEKEEAEIGEIKARILKEYTSNAVNMAILPEEIFLKKFLNFTDDEISLLEKIRDEMIQEEQDMIEKDKELEKQLKKELEEKNIKSDLQAYGEK